MTTNKSKAGAILLLAENGYTYILLVLGRAANKWGIPKGSIEKDESLEDAANREVYEETGIEIDKFDTKRMLSHNKSSYKLIYLPGCKKDYLIGTNDAREIKSVKWFSIRELLNIEQHRSNSTIKFLYRKTPWVH